MTDDHFFQPQPIHPDGSFELLISEVRSIADQLHELWRQYMSWYTFAFTANLLALSWAGLNQEFFRLVDSGSLRVPAFLFASIWIFINILNVLGSVVVSIYTSNQISRARRLLTAAYKASETPIHLRVKHNFPGVVSQLVGQANILALFAFIGVWTYIAARARGVNVDSLISAWLP